MSPFQTIYALASGRGRAGIAVVRLSGPDSARIINALSGAAVPEPRKARLTCLIDPGTGELIDRALVLWFPGPGSFTGEDVAEFHIHGGHALLKRLGRTLSDLGARPAEPGEFSRRAFEAGKLDLVQAEAIADLVDAETEQQRKLALRQLEGSLGALYREWRDRLVDMLARMEALIDFPDEGLDAAIGGEVRARIVPLLDDLQRHLVRAEKGRSLREGVEVAIAGPPNVGKSSLLNRLAGGDYAIVSERAGTTRDAIEAVLDLGGFRVVLVDTAGLRETEDPIEREGVKRSLARVDRADFSLWLTLPGVPPASVVGPRDLVVVNKIDLGNQPVTEGIGVSALTGEGFEGLLAALQRGVESVADVGEAPVLTRERHRLAVSEAAAAMARARTEGLGAELCAEDLRQALRALGRIVGVVDVEDLLDVIFSSFCIGK